MRRYLPVYRCAILWDSVTVILASFHLTVHSPEAEAVTIATLRLRTLYRLQVLFCSVYTEVARNFGWGGIKPVRLSFSVPFISALVSFCVFSFRRRLSIFYIFLEIRNEIYFKFVFFKFRNFRTILRPYIKFSLSFALFSFDFK